MMFKLLNDDANMFYDSSIKGHLNLMIKESVCNSYLRYRNIGDDIRVRISLNIDRKILLAKKLIEFKTAYDDIALTITRPHNYCVNIYNALVQSDGNE